MENDQDWQARAARRYGLLFVAFGLVIAVRAIIDGRLADVSLRT